MNTITLPAVRSIHLDFDRSFIHQALKKRKLNFLNRLNWPEAVKAMLNEVDHTENKLLHIESCCRKAIEENIKPMKDELEKSLLRKEGGSEVLG